MTTFPSIADPSISTATTLKDPALRSELGNGMTITRAKYTRMMQSWQLSWNALPDSQLATLKAFYNTVKGGSAEFDWTDEFGVTRSVRFTSKIKAQSVLDDHSSVSFDIEEV